MHETEQPPTTELNEELQNIQQNSTLIKELLMSIFDSFFNKKETDNTNTNTPSLYSISKEIFTILLILRNMGNTPYLTEDIVSAKLCEKIKEFYKLKNDLSIQKGGDGGVTAVIVIATVIAVGQILYTMYLHYSIVNFVKAHMYILNKNNSDSDSGSKKIFNTICNRIDHHMSSNRVIIQHLIIVKNYEVNDARFKQILEKELTKLLNEVSNNNLSVFARNTKLVKDIFKVYDVIYEPVTLTYKLTYNNNYCIKKENGSFVSPIKVEVDISLNSNNDDIVYKRNLENCL